MPLIMFASMPLLVETGYGTGDEAVGLIKTRRALETMAGGLKVNSSASDIKISSS
jgi:hypothetical protein